VPGIDSRGDGGYIVDRRRTTLTVFMNGLRVLSTAATLPMCRTGGFTRSTTRSKRPETLLWVAKRFRTALGTTRFLTSGSGRGSQPI
jgi:hypothetical protein